MKMYVATMITMMSVSTSIWANPLLLKCQLMKQHFAIDVESLTGNGCKTKTVTPRNVQVLTRYTVTLCDYDDATGIIEVLSMHGEWVPVGEFSTAKNCYLWREISTNYPCRPNRFGHRGGC